MSGGTVFERPTKTTEEAEVTFKNGLQEAEETTREPGAVRNVFISFHVDDEAQVNLLRSQAKNEATDLEFRDYSVKEPFDEKWKTNCKERISQTSATIVAIGAETASREAVIWEMEESYRQGHKVIGVRIYKDRNDPIPKPMLEHNAPIVNWVLNDIKRLLDDP